MSTVRSSQDNSSQNSSQDSLEGFSRQFDPSIDGRYTGRINYTGKHQNHGVHLIDLGGGLVKVASTDRLILEATERRLAYAMNVEPISTAGMIACLLPEDSLLRLMVGAAHCATNTDDDDEFDTCVEVMLAVLETPEVQRYMDVGRKMTLDMSNEAHEEMAFVLGTYHLFCDTPLGNGEEIYTFPITDDSSFDEILNPLSEGLSIAEHVASYLVDYLEAPRLVLRCVNIYMDEGSSDVHSARTELIIDALVLNDDVQAMLVELNDEIDNLDISGFCDDNGDIVYDDASPEEQEIMDGLIVIEVVGEILEVVATARELDDEECDCDDLVNENIVTEQVAGGTLTRVVKL